MAGKRALHTLRASRPHQAQGSSWRSVLVWSTGGDWKCLSGASSTLSHTPNRSRRDFSLPNRLNPPLHPAAIDLHHHHKAPAMSESVKRKLAVLLDQTSPLRTPKHARTRRPFGTPRTPFALPSTTTPPQPAAQGDDQGLPLPLPKTTYNPWSRAEFLNRLRTYSYRAWHDAVSQDDAEALTPVHCTARGWRAVETDKRDGAGSTVQCVHCGALLTIKFPEREAKDGAGEENDNDNDNDDGAGDDVQKAVRVALARRYKEDLLVTAHTPTCPWRRKGCDTTHVYAPLALTADVVDRVRARMRGLLDTPAQAALLQDPASGLNAQTEMALVRRTRRLVCDAAAPGDPDPGATKALLYAVHGWGLAASAPAMLECDMCFRRVLVPTGPQSEQSADEAPPRFDLVQEHHSYCAYVTGFVDQILASSRPPAPSSDATAAAGPESTPARENTPDAAASPSLPAGASPGSAATTPASAADEDADTELRNARLRRLKDLYSSPAAAARRHHRASSASPRVPSPLTSLSAGTPSRPATLPDLGALPSTPGTPTRKGR